MSTHAPTSSQHRKRQYETERKRRYRAGKRSELCILEEDIRRLKPELERLTVGASMPQMWREWVARAYHQRRASTEENKRLRDQLATSRDMQGILYRWVVSMLSRPTHMPRGTIPWLDSTLLANPVARQHGFIWLTDRLFYAAKLPQFTFDGNVDDVVRLDILTGNDGTEFLGTTTQWQTTVLASMSDVADCMWASLSDYTHSNFTTMETVQCSNQLLYMRLEDTLRHMNVCILLRRYDLANRVVIVRALVRDDECHPLRDPRQIQVHGFHWAVYEHIADDVTLLRSHVTQYVPVTTAGPLSLDQVTRMMHVQPHAAVQVVLAQLESHAQRLFVDETKHRYDDLNSRLDQRRIV
ncbi:Aste57867_12574 [Aphanomyces stellatus]|uniref:Aste57867_12574 protein n=1 Tax=Aphanomyces stellatus TaxID=120398 RepID=A0A485KWA9_9STRA|nr:hypothetical protein As57867_012528 [Aphanomyces stellatus]VFT89425.1 Aste57867_12574 [Aphanomyces stellatus]